MQRSRMDIRLKTDYTLTMLRRAAVVALMRIDSPGARETLQQASNDKNWEVWVYAAEALKHLESTMRKKPEE